jgi:hypothetical protein
MIDHFFNLTQSLVIVLVSVKIDSLLDVLNDVELVDCYVEHDDVVQQAF